MKDRGSKRAEKAKKRKDAERRRSMPKPSTTPAIDRLIDAIPKDADPSRMREALAMKDRAQELARRMRASRSLPVLQEIAAETGSRVDAAVAGVVALSPVKPACAKGCAYCCHIQVTVRAPEVFRALDFARAKLPEKLDAIRRRAAENAKRVRESETYPRMACAFLENGACLVYEARPVLCRSEHSYDAAVCRRVFETQTDETVVRNVEISGKAALELIPFGQAVDAVFPGHAVELQEAIDIALSIPDAAERWLAGEDVFESAHADETDAW